MLRSGWPELGHQTSKWICRLQPSSHSRAPLTLQFWLLAFFLGLVFLMGGTSRVDATSFIVLRPAAVIMCAIALLTLRREHWEGRGWLLWFLGAIFSLSLGHVIPLPPAIWQSLPGRVEVAELDHLTGLGDIWRPLTLTPMNGWHAFASLFAPLAVILLGLQLRRSENQRLLILLICFGALSGLLGLLQVIGDANGPLYLYRITNNGSAVGLFANRNHSALFLASLFPMLAIFASTPDGTADAQKARRLLAVAIGAMLLPLILVSGSRAGLVTAFVGLCSIPFLYRRPAEGRHVRHGGRRLQIKPLPAFGGLAIVITGMLTVIFSRAQSIDRLLELGAADDVRTDFWKISIELFWKYFPVGSGAGSFAGVYQIVEPSRMLSQFYVNRAHNDWLEIAVTYGLPGLLLIAVGVVAFVRRAIVVWGSDAAGRANQFARMSTILVVIFALASIPDYPMRSPTMMCVAAIAALWLAGGEAGRVGKKTTVAEGANDGAVS